MEVYWLGRAGYQETCALQEQLRQHVQRGGTDTLLLCEHDPVVTLGRYASTDDILVDPATLLARGVACARISRGGKVTYHGPGQLVAYPVVRLHRGVLAHIEWMAAAVVEVAGALGVHAAFSRTRVGVWTGERKLAAIGVHVSRRVAIHGLALNVTAESTAPFRSGWFVPCGEAGAPTTSLAQETQDTATTWTADTRTALTTAAVAEALAEALCQRAGATGAPMQRSTVSLLSQGRLVK